MVMKHCLWGTTFGLLPCPPSGARKAGHQYACSTGRQQYHDYANLSFMVSLLFILKCTENTIDDADYIINMIDLSLIIQ